jgi:pyruvate/2-oxoglutarate dehydrogenase complex dihydrolipoamide acyltransferase (E2) component
VSSLTTDTIVEVLMPQMGVSVTEGTVVGWSKAVGERVAADETICEISTDKIDSECPAPATGVVSEILIEVGMTVDTGTVLARIATDGPAVGGAGSDVSASPGSAASTAPDPLTGQQSEPTSAPVPTVSGRRYSPVVVRMAQMHDLDLGQVNGTGRLGRVTKKDVLALLDSDGPAPPGSEPKLHSDSPYRPEAVLDTRSAPADAVTTSAPPSARATDLLALDGVPQELSRMRLSIGAAMRASLETTAMCTTVVECDMTHVEERRRRLGLTALPVVARHTIDTLREFPALNATLDGSRYVRYTAVHLGIAVSLGEEGLIVPVIRDAQNLAEEGLADRIKDFAAQARGRRLSPDDVHGGTFTITSPGAFGAMIATPIINVPQIAILDLETIVRRPVVVTDPAGYESIAIRSMAHLCMSWDHRAIDGVYAAQFLTALRRRIESD